MARTNKIAVEITADDEASPVIDKLAKKIDGLEADEARVVVTANTDRLERKLDRARQQLEQLDGDEATVKLREIGNLEEDLAQSRRMFEQLDGQSGTVKLDFDDGGSLKSIKSQFEDLANVGGELSGSLAGMGPALASPAVAVAGIGAGLLAAANSASNTALEVKALADLTGSSVEETSRLAAVWADFSGGEINDLADIMVNINNSLRDSPELAERLGINMGDGATGAERFLEVTAAINDNIATASERQAIGSQLYGEEGIRQMARVLAVVDDISEAVDDVNPLRVVDDHEVEAAREYAKNVAEMKAAWGGFVQEAGNTVIPMLNGIGTYLDAVGNAGDLAGDKLNDLFGGDRLDNRRLVEAFNESEEAGAAWIESNLEGIESMEQLKAMLADSGLELHAQNLAIVAFANADVAESTDEAVEAIETIGPAAETSLGRATRAYQLYRDKLNDRSAYLSVLDAADRLEQAQIAAWTAGIDGAEDFTQKQRAAEQSQIDFNGQVLTYLEGLEGIPPELLTQIALELDGQSVADTLTTLSGIEATRRTVTYDVTTRGFIPVTGDGSDASRPPSDRGLVAIEAGQPAGNVYVTVPTADPSAIMGAVQRWARINGRIPINRGR